MRFKFLTGMLLAACLGACGPSPSDTTGSGSSEGGTTEVDEETTDPSIANTVTTDLSTTEDTTAGTTETSETDTDQSTDTDVTTEGVTATDSDSEGDDTETEGTTEVDNDYSCPAQEPVDNDGWLSCVAMLGMIGEEGHPCQPYTKACTDHQEAMGFGTDLGRYGALSCHWEGTCECHAEHDPAGAELAKQMLCCVGIHVEGGAEACAVDVETCEL